MKRGILVLLLLYPLHSQAQNPLQLFQQILNQAGKESQNSDQPQQSQSPQPQPSPSAQLPRNLRPEVTAAIQKLQIAKQKVSALDPDNTTREELISVGRELAAVPERINQDLDFSDASERLAQNYDQERRAALVAFLDKHLAYILGRILELPDTPSLADDDQFKRTATTLSGWERSYMRYLSFSSPADGPLGNKWKNVKNNLDQKNAKIVALTTQSQKKAETSKKQDEQKQVDAQLKAQRQNIAKLGFSNEYLQAMVFLNFMGQNGKYRRFDEWLAMVFSNPSVKQVTQVNIQGGKLRGVSIKQEGQPSMTFIFNFDGGELYLTHLGNNQEVVKVNSPAAMSRATMEVMRMAKEGPYANVGQ